MMPSGTEARQFKIGGAQVSPSGVDWQAILFARGLHLEQTGMMKIQLPIRFNDPRLYTVIPALGIINPRRACAARVTVVVLCVCVCVCVCVCLRLFSDYRLRGGL